MARDSGVRARNDGGIRAITSLLFVFTRHPHFHDRFYVFGFHIFLASPGFEPVQEGIDIGNIDEIVGQGDRIIEGQGAVPPLVRQDQNLLWLQHEVVGRRGIDITRMRQIIGLYQIHLAIVKPFRVFRPNIWAEQTC